MHVQFFHVDRAARVEEVWSLSKLEEASFTHCLLDDDVEDLAHRLTVLPIRIIDVGGVDNVLSLEIDLECDLVTHQLRLNNVALIKLLGGPDVEARVDELSNEQFNTFCLTINNLGHFERSKLV